MIITLKSIYICACVSVTNRRWTTRQEPGGEPMSIWRIQSTTPDGSSNTFWEKVSAALLHTFNQTHGVEGGINGVRLRESL